MKRLCSPLGRRLSVSRPPLSVCSATWSGRDYSQHVIPPSERSVSCSSSFSLPNTFVSPAKEPMGSFEKEVREWEPRQDLAVAPTPPASWYVSPEFLKREAKSVFHSNWLYAARVEEVANPGDYVAGEILGEPYVVVRGDDGELRAFFNVCRHHASKVALGSGCASELVCPYHGWTYRLDGKLKMAPRIGGIQDFKARDFGLKSLAVTTWGRWVFVNVDSSATWHPSQEFKHMEDVLEKTNYKSLKFALRKEYQLNCNWKVYVDNYLDGGYHIEHLHKSLNAQLNMRQYVTDTFSKFSLQSCPGTGEEEYANTSTFLRDRIGSKGAYYAYMYPNLTINRYGDMLDTNLVIPLSADQTLVYFDYYYDPNSKLGQDEPARKEGELPQWLKDSIKISDQIQDEDAWISESVQKGLSSSAYNTGRYAPKVEMAAFHFHQLLRQDYEKAFSV